VGSVYLAQDRVQVQVFIMNTVVNLSISLGEGGGNILTARETVNCSRENLLHEVGYFFLAIYLVVTELVSYLVSYLIT
jgi:hypothetical protein